MQALFPHRFWLLADRSSTSISALDFRLIQTLSEKAAPADIIRRRKDGTVLKKSDADNRERDPGVSKLGIGQMNKVGPSQGVRRPRETRREGQVVRNRLWEQVGEKAERTSDSMRGGLEASR